MPNLKFKSWIVVKLNEMGCGVLRWQCEIFIFALKSDVMCFISFQLHCFRPHGRFRGRRNYFLSGGLFAKQVLSGGLFENKFHHGVFLDSWVLHIAHWPQVLFHLFFVKVTKLECNLFSIYFEYLYKILKNLHFFKHFLIFTNI